jgi:hypothetical protein
MQIKLTRTIEETIFDQEVPQYIVDVVKTLYSTNPVIPAGQRLPMFRISAIKFIREHYKMDLVTARQVTDKIAGYEPPSD